MTGKKRLTAGRGEGGAERTRWPSHVRRSNILGRNGSKRRRAVRIPPGFTSGLQRPIGNSDSAARVLKLS